jgi:hypothetical protein
MFDSAQFISTIYLKRLKGYFKYVKLLSPNYFLIILKIVIYFIINNILRKRLIL